MTDTVLIFGAGATKACGGPLTNEILPQAFEPAIRTQIEREYFVDLLDTFLIEHFYVPPTQAERADSDYPALPLLLSLVDKALDNNHPMGPDWSVDKLRQVRRALQYVIFALLEFKLRSLQANYYADLIKTLHTAGQDLPTIISLNYDLIVDNALVSHTTKAPEYGCAISTDRYRLLPHSGSLLKIHGSLNWSYCPGCNRLDVGVSETGQMYKMLQELYIVNPLEDRYSCHGFPCSECETFVEPVLITPTQLKDYRNHHVTRVWSLAEGALRQAKRVFIVGYSLPDDDLDVIYLLKRGLGQLAKRSPQSITVVETPTLEGVTALDQHPVGRRYRTIFGPNIDWRTGGFEGLVASLSKNPPDRSHQPLATN
jgi:hypothetical protein